jgi:hypothetical protein
VAINVSVPAPLVAASVAVALVALAGWAMVAGFVFATQRNALRRAAEQEVRQSDFERERAAYDEREFQKLPADPGLWQLIQFTHSFHPEVQRACLARIAAKPELERETIELLGTGWAQHALHWLRDFYPLPRKSLAPAYATFLDAELERWEKSLAHDPNPGGWEVNLNVYFDLAEKMVADGGDLRAPLGRWREFLTRTKGLGGLARRIESIR